MFSFFIHNGQLFKLNSQTGETWILGSSAWVPLATEKEALK